MFYMPNVGILLESSYFQNINLYVKLNIVKVNRFTGHEGAVYSLCKGKTDSSFISAGGDGRVIEWDLNDPEKAKLLASSPETLFKVKYEPSMESLLFGNMSGGLHWINLQQKTNVSNIAAHQKGVYDIQFIDNRFFTFGGDGQLVCWTTKTQRPAESTQFSHKALRDTALHPNNNQLAIASSDCAVYILNSKTLENEYQISQAHTNSVFCVAYSIDGRYLVTGGRDAQIRVWDVDDEYALVDQIPAHLFTVNRLRLQPGGKLMASASRDKTIKLWRTDSFNLVKVIDFKKFQSHVNSVNDLLWLSDTDLISCSDDRIIYHWKVC